MAAPSKQKLDYFPFDVDFFTDEKIEAISGEFGIKGEIVAIKLLCAIYRNGYFILWSEMLKMKLLKNLPGINPELLEQIVNRLVRWGFFDETLFNSVKVLTSTGIQKRFLEASKRRKGVDASLYWLLEKSTPEVNVSINEVNVNINKQATGNNANIYEQSKRKEIKGKGIEKKEEIADAPLLFDQEDVVSVEKPLQSKIPPVSPPPPKSEFDQAIDDFIDMRKKIKHPVTEHGIKLLFAELEKLAPGDSKHQIKILNRSILNSWRGVFPLNNENNGTKDFASRRQIAEPKKQITSYGKL